MPPPYLAESPYRVIIEFQKSNAGVGRVIKLAYTSLEVPAQLHGGIPIEVWDPFMEDVEQLAKEHPYTASQSADQCCFNVGGLTCFLCIGVGCMEPDGGDYNVWERKVAACVQKHAEAFARGGCNVSMHHFGGTYWIQVDVNPAMAVSFAGPPAGHNPPKDPYGMPPSVPPTAVPPPDIYSPPKDPNMPPPVSMYPHAPPVPPPYGVAPPSYPPAPPPYGAPSPYGAPPAYGHPPPPFCPPAPPGRPLP
mmetsp:Transcript_16701/g.45950  ORF Transcript_16701/g.45950 Transcript_16701/m.45950 type:complete len:249 (+) Transcript_16701:53-799(+)